MYIVCFINSITQREELAFDELKRGNTVIEEVLLVNSADESGGQGSHSLMAISTNFVTVFPECVVQKEQTEVIVSS